MGRVANGTYAGMTFAALAGEYGSDSRGKWLGSRFTRAPFPLLVKIIDAGDDLSIQVHPDDAQALAISGDANGKSEMWYVLDAPDNGSLIIGLKDGISTEGFAKAVNGDNGQAVERMLNRLPVKRGDVVYIPAGLIHAITKGVMVAEIQQNSNRTYRLYDYGRKGSDGKPRQLDKEDALKVINFDSQTKRTTVPGIHVQGTPFTYYIANRNFCAVMYELNETEYNEISDPDKFFIFTCVEGGCMIKTADFAAPLSESYSAFIPAGLGEYTIESKHCKLMKSFVPDIDRDFYQPLLKAGYTKQEIYFKTAIE